MPVGTPQLNPPAALILSSVAPASAGSAAPNAIASTAAAVRPIHRPMKLRTVAPSVGRRLSDPHRQRDWADANTAPVRLPNATDVKQNRGRWRVSLSARFHIGDDAGGRRRRVIGLNDRPAGDEIVGAARDRPCRRAPAPVICAGAA